MLNIPNLDQLDHTVDPDINKYNNCGETAISDIARSMGIIEPIPQIKTDETGNPNFIGYSDVTEMADWFMNRGIPAVAITVLDVPGYIRQSLEQGFPCVYLRWWNLSAQTGGHFVVPVGYDPSSDIFTINNPWGGVIDTWTSSQVQNNSKYGWVIQVQKKELNMNDILIQQWKSRKTDVAVNPNAAIFKDWLARRQNSDYTLGVPVTEEFSYNGGTAQIFTNAIGMWDATNGVTWK